MCVFFSFSCNNHKSHFVFVDVCNARPIGPQLIGVMVGNKCDFRNTAEAGGNTADSRVQVSKQDGMQTAQSLDLTYFETSAVSFRFNHLYFVPC